MACFSNSQKHFWRELKCNLRTCFWLSPGCCKYMRCCDVVELGINHAAMLSVYVFNVNKTNEFKNREIWQFLWQGYSLVVNFYLQLSPSMRASVALLQHNNGCGISNMAAVYCETELRYYDPCTPSAKSHSRGQDPRSMRKDEDCSTWKHIIIH